MLEYAAGCQKERERMFSRSHSSLPSLWSTCRRKTSIFFVFQSQPGFQSIDFNLYSNFFPSELYEKVTPMAFWSCGEKNLIEDLVVKQHFSRSFFWVLNLIAKAFTSCSDGVLFDSAFHESGVVLYESIHCISFNTKSSQLHTIICGAFLAKLMCLKKWNDGANLKSFKSIQKIRKQRHQVCRRGRDAPTT